MPLDDNFGCKERELSRMKSIDLRLMRGATLSAVWLTYQVDDDFQCDELGDFLLASSRVRDLMPGWQLVAIKPHKTTSKKGNAK